MKKVLLFFFTSVLATAAYAQIDTPKYKCTAYTGSTWISTPWRIGGDWKVQAIYYPSNFPGMPSGSVKNVYIRACDFTPQSNTFYYGFKVKIAATTATKYSDSTRSATKKDTFYVFNQGNTVVDLPVLSIPGPTNLGTWIKLPVNSSSFNYSTLSNMVVEIYLKGSPPINGFNLMTSKTTGGIYRMMTNFTDSLYGGAAGGTLPDLGFDLVTTNVASIKNISSFGLFPNPSTDGHFNISFDAVQAVDEVAVTVTNITGQQVWKEHFRNVGNNFFKEVNLVNAPKGTYFAEIVADGDRITRRLIIE